ncbi:MAG: methyltransferase domain-containing protein [Cyanobacteriota bacterium]|nr:methyltransferase domain-containing protein [Cyanobacteriota bacterium]
MTQTLQSKTQKPYNALLDLFRQGNTDVIQAFGQHIHWGYWDAPTLADGSTADFARAAEALSLQVCDAAQIEEGQRILDAGCGFGGTIASLNDRFTHLDLVGLNISGKQLDRAREQVRAKANNRIEFVEGDACELPFEDNSFDVVLAVECIFHFPSREKFFQEVRRVLRPGGRLALCDFIPAELVQPLVRGAYFLFGNAIVRTYGQGDFSYSIADYQNLARRSNLTSLQERDITLNTLPTYPMLCRLIRSIEDSPAGRASEFVTQALEWGSRQGLIRYTILSYEVPATDSSS